ncbi:MAG: hypothetical protein LBH54_05635, partial [Clostridiales bacterium]|nr:hypothetical protein [Clostridiales bacterium]
MTDQKFFGMWDGTEWVIPPVLQYDGALGGVLAHSKNGDYERAKTALLTYYKGRPTAINFTRNDNNPLHVEMAAEKIFSFIQNDGAAGKVTVSPQWGSYSVP